MIYNIYNDNNQEFEYDLANMILKKNKPPLFLCVGSNKIVADSLGAITGELLKNHYNIDNIVIGDMTSPIISSNLSSTIEKLNCKYFNHTIIVIDSTIGELKDMYHVKLNNYGLPISYQTNKKFVGDISISSVCYVKGINGLLILNSEEKKFVFETANYIAHRIKLAIDICKKLNYKLVTI